MGYIERPALKENLEELIDFAVNFGRAQGFTGAGAENTIRLACEEALVNVISYAYPGATGTVKVDCYPEEGGGIRIEISDSGIAFDPLSLPPPDLNLPMEQRKIGGMGIYMIRKIMNKVEYRRENGKNILAMTKFK